MKLKEMSFKGQRVFVEVDERGEPVVEDGRARMRYRPGDDRVYRPSPANLKDIEHGNAVRDTAAAVAYTDGACVGNPGPAGLGYVVVFPDGRRVARGEPLGRGTNNIGELKAIQRVLEIAGDPGRPLVVHSDSEYAIGVLSLGWKPRANRELVAEIRGEIERLGNVTLRKVPAHAGVAENEVVDRLARRAAEIQASVED